MRLIDAEEADRLYGVMGPGREAVRRIGGQHRRRAGRIRLHARASSARSRPTSSARFYQHDITSRGVEFLTPPRSDVGVPTARSLILVTPDAQRTMNTFLGAAQHCSAARSIDRRQIADAGNSLSRRLFVGSAGAARGDGSGDRGGAGGRAQGRLHLCRTASASPATATVSSTLIDDGRIDILFANEAEITELAGTQDFEAAVAAIRAKVPIPGRHAQRARGDRVGGERARRSAGRADRAPGRHHRARATCSRRGFWRVRRADGASRSRSSSARSPRPR